MMEAEELFVRLPEKLQAIVKIAGCGYRVIHPEERFFDSRQEAEKFGEHVLEEKDQEQIFAGTLVGIVVVVTFHSKSKLGITTTTNIERAREQAALIIKAANDMRPGGIELRILWECLFLPSETNF